MLRDFLKRAPRNVVEGPQRQLQRAAAALMERAGREDAAGLYRESHEWNEMARLIDRQAARSSRKAAARRSPLGRGAAARMR